MPPLRRAFRVARPFAPVVALALSACAAAPPFREAPASPTPLAVAAEPQGHAGSEVVWGGKILGVRNRADVTEIEIAACPLDRAQRPDPSAPGEGRFVVVVAGYAEPLDYPPGRFATVRGRLDGTRLARIDEREVVLPKLRSEALHLWPANFPRERGSFRFGVGIGVGIR